MTSPSLSVISDRTAYPGRPVKGRQFSLAGIAAFLYSPFATIIGFFLSIVYQFYQRTVSVIFTPAPIALSLKPAGRIAIIGAGITGISSAAHFISHGFEVVIFEEEKEVGGIWARVNVTSSLQLNSILYRFFPSIIWSDGFPKRDEIVGQVVKIWKDYNLESSTKFSTRVTSVVRQKSTSTSPAKRGHGRWIINESVDLHGTFDAVIGAIGSCGKPKKTELKGHADFKGLLIHSSELDGAELKGKKVVIVGSGASGVESAEQAVLMTAAEVVLLARSDKWIISRNTIFDVLLALKPYGAETRLSWIPEQFIRIFHYGSQAHLSPATKGLFQGTPICNDEFLKHTAQRRIDYKRGDAILMTKQGIKFIERERGTKPGDAGESTVITADVVVMATGFSRPSLDIFPKDLFPIEGDRNYQPPNLYLQNFATEDWSILLTNASYKDAIGTVGNWHIGLYARILMVFLLDDRTRPSPRDMKTWVDVMNYLKVASFGNQDHSGLDFFTYAELIIWIVAFHAFRISRLKWLPFVLFGFGVKGSAPSLVKQS